MSYYIIGLPREDLEHCIKIGCFGTNNSGRVRRVKVGDKVVLYATKIYKILGVGQVTRGFYVGKSSVFLAGPGYENRIGFRSVTVDRDEEADFKELVPELHLTKKATRWGVIFMNPIVEIDEHDWNLIVSRLPEKLLKELEGPANTAES